jgi:hypothetical protein
LEEEDSEEEALDEEASDEEASDEEALEEPVPAELLELPFEELVLTVAFLLEADKAGSLPEASCT